MKARERERERGKVCEGGSGLSAGQRPWAQILGQILDSSVTHNLRTCHEEGTPRPTPSHHPTPPLLSQIQRIKVLQVLLLQQGSDCAVTIYYQIPLNQIMIMMGALCIRFYYYTWTKKLFFHLIIIYIFLKFHWHRNWFIWDSLQKVLDVVFYIRSFWSYGHPSTIPTMPYKWFQIQK
jgi:hypothetical protein